MLSLNLLEDVLREVPWPCCHDRSLEVLSDAELASLTEPFNEQLLHPRRCLVGVDPLQDLEVTDA